MKRWKQTLCTCGFVKDFSKDADDAINYCDYEELKNFDLIKNGINLFDYGGVFEHLSEHVTAESSNLNHDSDCFSMGSLLYSFVNKGIINYGPYMCDRAKKAGLAGCVILFKKGDKESDSKHGKSWTLNKLCEDKKMKFGHYYEDTWEIISRVSTENATTYYVQPNKVNYEKDFKNKRTAFETGNRNSINGGCISIAEFKEKMEKKKY